MADNVNISPEMIENLVNAFKKTNNSGNTNTTNSTDETNYSSKENTIDLNEVLKKFTSSSESSNRETSDNPTSFENFDIGTIMKIKSIMDSLNNKNDPDSRLLYSLKPYLRKSRQDKLDQYINFLKVSQISKLFSKH